MEILKAPAKFKTDLAVGMADDDLSFTLSSGTDLDGNPVRLEDLRGKLVWLNFWASWCSTCKIEAQTVADVEKVRERRERLLGIGRVVGLRPARELLPQPRADGRGRGRS